MSWAMDRALSGVAFDRRSPQGPLCLDVAIPLVVDLDGTLFLSDTLQEILAATVFRSPALAVAILSRIVHGRPTLKRYATERYDLDVATLPFRQDLMQLLNAERNRGREIHLVTAADQAMADRVSSTFAIFTSAVGSDGKRNLKAEAKLDYLRQRFPDGFIYAGDSRADRPIFRAARGAILCDVNRAVARDVAASDTPVIAEFRQSEPLWKAWLRALRVRQWARNALIFVPLLVGHTLSEPKSVAMTCLGFLLLCGCIRDLSHHRPRRYRRRSARRLKARTIICERAHLDLRRIRGGDRADRRLADRCHLPLAGLCLHSARLFRHVDALFVLFQPHCGTRHIHYWLARHESHPHGCGTLDGVTAATNLVLRDVFFLAAGARQTPRRGAGDAQSREAQRPGHSYRAEDWPVT